MAASTAGRSRPPVNILLVDDQQGKLLTYETILAELGENLIRASSGTEALDRLLRTDIAVVLVDVCMPEIDGFELSAMIRNHPRYQKTAIILVSSVLVDDVDRLKGYHSGAVDYVSVPIVPEILRAKVAVFAELYRKTEELAQLNRELERRVAERTQEIERLLAQAEQARREAERANRLKDEFLATLSHELRTPLHAITGWAHLLRSGELDPSQQQRGLETISRNAEAQSQIISEILDVSRIVTGKLRLETRLLDLRAVVEASLETVRLAASAKQITITSALDDAGEGVSGDPGRLQQVIWNLLQNAIKFTPPGGHVEVSLSNAPSQVTLLVRDDGPGIPPEFLPFVFDRFRQADSSSTRPHQGLGLGLAIVRHLIEMHGGTVEAANRVDGPGAAFRIVLPRQGASRHDERSRSATPSGQAWDDPESLRGIRVLVVDDEADSRDLVATLLRQCGAEPCVAASAAEAVQSAGEAPPDVVLTDIEMPGEDGYSLLRSLRELSRERGGATPVVALTAYAGQGDREKALAAGFDAHVAKPIRPPELIAAILELVTSSRRAVVQVPPEATGSRAPTKLFGKS